MSAFKLTLRYCSDSAKTDFYGRGRTILRGREGSGRRFSGVERVSGVDPPRWRGFLGVDSPRWRGFLGVDVSRLFRLFLYFLLGLVRSTGVVCLRAPRPAAYIALLAPGQFKPVISSFHIRQYLQIYWSIWIPFFSIGSGLGSARPRPPSRGQRTPTLPALSVRGNYRSGCASNWANGTR